MEYFIDLDGNEFIIIRSNIYTKECVYSSILIGPSAFKNYADIKDFAVRSLGDFPTITTEGLTKRIEKIEKLHRRRYGDETYVR